MGASPSVGQKKENAGLQLESSGLSLGNKPGPRTLEQPGGINSTINRDDGKMVKALAGQRDWTIFIECRTDAVVLYPGGLRLGLAGVSPDEGGQEQVVEAVQQMLARRKAMIGSNELFRPKIRFLVRPDGLRTYYRAFPALEMLGVPMTRENLEQDEKAPRRIHGG